MNKKAFTLLELLVVVLIIGILATIALPQYKVAVGRTKFATIKNDTRTIKNALHIYYLTHDTYTTNLNDLDVEIKSNCEIFPSNNPLIRCVKTISGSNMSFVLGYHTRQSLKACYIHSDITNATSNKICQLETGKTTPNEDSGYKAYFY